jgi:hypothetical protein
MFDEAWTGITAVHYPDISFFIRKAWTPGFFNNRSPRKPLLFAPEID